MNTARKRARRPEVGRRAPPPERMASPKKNATKLSSSQKTNVATAVTPILVASRSGRRGVAASVVRIVPLAYSPVIKQRSEHAAGQGGDDHAGQRLLGRVEAEHVVATVRDASAEWVDEPGHQEGGDDREAEGDGGRSQRQDLDDLGPGHVLDAVVARRDCVDCIGHLRHFLLAGGNRRRASSTGGTPPRPGSAP